MHEILAVQQAGEPGVVVVQNGAINCVGTHVSCSTSALASAEVVDLRGGAIAPGLTTFGSPLGLAEIEAESSTNDGLVYDPLTQKVPSILGGDAALVRAVDGLQFGGRSALLAYRAGVTAGISAPQGRRFYAGLSTTFATGALNKLDVDAVVQEFNAVHVTVRHFGRAPSVSTQIGTLRRLLLHPPKGDAGQWFKNIAEVRLVILSLIDGTMCILTCSGPLGSSDACCGHRQCRHHCNAYLVEEGSRR